MPDTVYISKFDESYIHIEADRGILMELQDRFSFTVKNAAFIPAVKNKQWDGKIRLLNLRTGNLYYGLHREVQKFCEENDYECEYIDPIDVEAAFSVDEFDQMVKALKLSRMTEEGRVEIVPHDFQAHAVIHAIQAGRTLLLSPTASGKSLMIYLLLRYFLAKTKGKILLLVPTSNLVQQMYDDFTDYAELVPWSVEENCHMIFDGSEKHTDKRVTISTWQALAVKERIPAEIRADLSPAQIKAWNKQAPYILENDFFEQFVAVFGDECHLFASEDSAKGGGELMQIMSLLSNATYRFGTTGTLKDSKINSMILEGLFGEVYQTTTTREMIDAGKAADIIIKCLQLQYNDATKKKMRGCDYQEEIDFLMAHEGRNRFIRNLAVSLKENTLVLFDQKEKHGEILYNMILKKVRPGRKVFYIQGDMAPKERNAIRKIVETEQDAIIVASYGTFSTGVNIANLFNLIFGGAGGKAKIKFLQSIGRGLRLSKRKRKIVVHDLSDDLSCWNKAGTSVKDNYTLEHFTERVNYYNSEQFEYRKYKIKIEE